VNVEPNQIANFRGDAVSKHTSKFNNVMVETDTMENILRENSIDDLDLMVRSLDQGLKIKHKVEDRIKE
jgi:hypothetical protein